MSNPTPNDALARLSDAVAATVSEAGRSLVRVGGRGSRGTTGVALQPSVLVASSRMLRHDDGLRATLDDRDAELELVGRDDTTDLAVLRFVGEAPDWAPTPVVWRSEDDLRVGELVVGAARPGQTLRGTLAGLAVVGGAVRLPRGTRLGRYLELDRDLPRGFAGALLVDANGRGLAVRTRSFRGAAWLLPGSTVLKVAAEILAHGHVQRGWLGVGVVPARLPAPLAQQLGQHHAIVVVSLEDDGPAAQANVQIGDVVVAIDGEAVESPLALQSKLSDRSGESLEVRVLRNGRVEALPVNIGARP